MRTAVARKENLDVGRLCGARGERIGQAAMAIATEGKNRIMI